MIQLRVWHFCAAPYFHIFAHLITGHDIVLARSNNLNLISQKTQRVLKGADAAVLWFYLVKETTNHKATSVSF